MRDPNERYLVSNFVLVPEETSSEDDSEESADSDQEKSKQAEDESCKYAVYR